MPPLAAPASGPSTKQLPWEGELQELWLEHRLRLFAIPSALLVALLFHASAIGHMLQRTFLSMMVHELGHAVTAWLCGVRAIPTVWRTLHAERRDLFTPLLVAAAIGYLLYRALRAHRPFLVGLACASLLLQAIGTLLLAPRTVQVLITFGGDGGAMVIGTALMATFYSGRETQIHKGWLRWGFLVIGAAAFVDTFATWYQARKDWDAIPFGEIEGVGLSDPTRLTDVYGWATQHMVSRYVSLGIACLVALTCFYAVGLARSHRELARSRLPCGAP